MSKKRKWFQYDDVVLTITLLDQYDRPILEMPAKTIPQGGNLTMSEIEIRTDVQFGGGKGWVHGKLRIDVTRP